MENNPMRWDPQRKQWIDDASTGDDSGTLFSIIFYFY